MKLLSRIRTLTAKHIHFSKFLVIGGINTLLDLALYFVFANLLRIPPVTSSILSTGITMCFSFYMNHRYVFSSSKRKRETIIQFFGVTMFNVWLIQSTVISLVLHVLRGYPYFDDKIWTLNLVAKLCGVGVSFVLNFLMYRYIFKGTQAAASSTVL
jgi:putative flippase GtrA